MLDQLIFGATHKVVYTNWQGETEVRTLMPQALFYGSTEHHPREQWLVQCLDVERGHVRHYSLDSMVPYGSAWDQRKLGASEEHVVVATPEEMETFRAILAKGE